MLTVNLLFSNARLLILAQFIKALLLDLSNTPGGMGSLWRPINFLKIQIFLFGFKTLYFPILCAKVYNMKRTNYYYPEPMLKELKAHSKETGIAVSEHIRRAIAAYLEKITVLRGQVLSNPVSDVRTKPQNLT